MIEIKVKNELNNREYKAVFDSNQEADSWFNSCVEKNSFGLPKRWVSEKNMKPELEDRIIHSAIFTIDRDGNTEELRHEIKCDYEVNRTDLSKNKDFRNKSQVELRKKEYPSIEKILHVILDHGFDSQEMMDIENLRQAVKAKYPLEP